MKRRHRWFALALGALWAALSGCGEEKPAPPSGGTKTPAASGTPSAPAQTAPAKTTAQPTKGTAVIQGVAKLTGKPPEMKVPAKRKDMDFCKDKPIPLNAVIAKDGKLKDVIVRIGNGGVAGDWKAPEQPAVLDQRDCMYEPRIQGVVSGQTIEIRNSDATLHNVHTYRGSETWFNQAQPKGAAPIVKDVEEKGLIKVTCDVHPWMRSFVVATDHPFFAVSGEDGSFAIKDVPAGKYELEAWHSHYGLKKASVEVADGKQAEVTFTYEGNEPEPAENAGELKGM